MAGRFDVRRDRSWNEQNEDNYWSSNVRHEDRRDDRRGYDERRGHDERGRHDQRGDDRGRSQYGGYDGQRGGEQRGGERRDGHDRDQYGRGELDSWNRHHDYDDSFDRTWHGAHGADRQYNQRREAMSQERREWERYNDIPRSRIDEDRSRWNQRFEDDRRWQPSRGGDHYDRGSDFSHGREIPRHGRDNRTAPYGEDRYRGDERFRGDERYRGDERSRDDERFRGAELRPHDRMRDDDPRNDGRGRESRHGQESYHGRESQQQGREPQQSREPQRGNKLTWRDFDRWSDDRIDDARHPGLGFSRGDDYHDRFWSTGDRHRDAW